MTPEQRRWLRRAKELAAEIQRRFKALQADVDLRRGLEEHLQTLLNEPEWHGETLDTFLKDMLPLADCCASLEGQLPDGGYARYTSQRCILFLLAADVSAVSNLLLTALNVRLKSGPTPPPALITRLTLSASVAIRWWPKALRATAEAELDQGMEPSETLATQALLDLLFLAGQAVKAMSTAGHITNHRGSHTEALRATLCAPATLASALGNLAAVYARFALFPATFKDKASDWFNLSMVASYFLHFPVDRALAVAVEENDDVQEQLAAALLPYAAHLLKVADLQDVDWLKAWGQLVPALASQAVWPSPKAVVAGRATQRSMAVQEGLVRLLRALPPVDKPPRPYCHAREWQAAALAIPLNTAKAAAAAATQALEALDLMPQGEVQVVALQLTQQQGFCTMLALLPTMVNLLGSAAEQLAASDTGRKFDSQANVAYIGALQQLTLLVSAASEILGKEEGVTAGAQPEELAAAAEAALRLVAQVAALEQPLSCNKGQLEENMSREFMTKGRQLFLCLLPAAEEEASAAPEPGRVRPSLQAQLRLVHTACKFVRTALALGAAASIWDSDGGGLLAHKVRSVHLLLGHSNLLLVSHLQAGAIPQGRAPLTPLEKRALVGAALAQSAAGSAVVHLLPEGQARETQRASNVLQLCRFLAEPELADALLAQHAELAEQLLAGLAAAMQQKAFQQAAEGNRFDCSRAVQGAVQANRHLGPIMLGGAAGEALEAALQQSMQGSTLEVAVRCGFWVNILAALMGAAQGCFDSSGRAAAAQLQMLLQSPAGVQGLPLEGWEALRGMLQSPAGVQVWEALHGVRAAADEWLAQEAQQQWRQEQLLLCAKAAGMRACSNLACTNLIGASEAGLKARQCSGCRCVRYCSTACQRADWATGHKALCKRLQARQAAGG